MVITFFFLSSYIDPDFSYAYSFQSHLSEYSPLGDKGFQSVFDTLWQSFSYEDTFCWALCALPVSCSGRDSSRVRREGIA